MADDLVLWRARRRPSNVDLAGDNFTRREP
jgi:hypothetical protein